MKSNKERYADKLLGHYHFDGPMSLRPLAVYKDKPFTIGEAMRKFGKTLAAKMKGKEYHCDWKCIKHEGNRMDYIIEIRRRSPKIPSRCIYPIAYRISITMQAL